MATRKYWVVGDLVEIKVGKNETEGMFSVIETTVPPGGGPPLHTHHREHESFYVIDGEIEFTVDGTKIVAPAGSVVHGRRGVPHRFENRGEKPARMLVHMCPGGLEDFFVEAGDLVTDSGSQPPKPDIEKVMRLAPKYGLEIHI